MKSSLILRDSVESDGRFADDDDSSAADMRHPLIACDESYVDSMFVSSRAGNVGKEVVLDAKTDDSYTSFQPYSVTSSHRHRFETDNSSS